MSWSETVIKIKLVGLKSLLNEETKKKNSLQNQTTIRSLKKQISELEEEIKGK